MQGLGSWNDGVRFIGAIYKDYVMHNGLLFTRSFRTIVHLKYIEYGAYVDLIIVYPKPCSIYLRGSIPT